MAITWSTCRGFTQAVPCRSGGTHCTINIHIYFPLLVTATRCIRRHHSLKSIDSFSVGRELGHSSSSLLLLLSKSRSLVATNVDSSLGIVSVIGHKMLPKLNAHSVTPTAQPRSRSLDTDVRCEFCVFNLRRTNCKLFFYCRPHRPTPRYITMAGVNSKMSTETTMTTINNKMSGRMQDLNLFFVVVTT